MFLTVMAYKVFLSEQVRTLVPFYCPVYWLLWLQVDVAITEVGIGGTFDCTNVVQ